MSSSSNALIHLFLTAAVTRMQLSEADIDRCVDRLSEEQIWSHGGDHENSIANLLLHLEGNLRQWFLHGIDGQPDVRTRDAEFSPTPTLRSADIRRRFAATLAECRAIIGGLPIERLHEMINPQPSGNWPAMSILEAILRVTGHLQLHQGQIILLTKQLTGADLDLSIPRKR
jgi:hypothetical protein